MRRPWRADLRFNKFKPDGDVGFHLQAGVAFGVRLRDAAFVGAARRACQKETAVEPAWEKRCRATHSKFVSNKRCPDAQFIVVPGERGHYLAPIAPRQRRMELREVAELALEFFRKQQE